MVSQADFGEQHSSPRALIIVDKRAWEHSAAAEGQSSGRRGQAGHRASKGKVLEEGAGLRALFS